MNAARSTGGAKALNQAFSHSFSGFYFSLLGTSEEANAQRLKAVARHRAILMALLPRDGSPITIKRLAASAYMPDSAVTEALFDVYLEGRIGFDVRADTFNLVVEAHP